MYLSSIDRPHAARSSRRRALFLVSGNVFALGAVSLITDISSEMVTAVLPVYLMIGLHLSPTVYGVVDGTHTGATALLRLVGGYVADRARRRKFIAGLGYGLSAVAKLGLLAAGNAVGAIGAVIALDRTGKGLRTAPRDALITLSTPPRLYGRAFGVHRMMDTIGAFAGPLVALAILAGTAQAYDAVFVTSFCIAAFGVLVLVLFVRDHRDEQPAKATVAPSALRGLLRIAPVRRLVLAACLAGTVTIGDGFVYLLLQRREELSIGWFPLLAVGTNLSYFAVGRAGGCARRQDRPPEGGDRRLPRVDACLSTAVRTTRRLATSGRRAGSVRPLLRIDGRRPDRAGRTGAAQRRPYDGDRADPDRTGLVLPRLLDTLRARLDDLGPNWRDPDRGCNRRGRRTRGCVAVARDPSRRGAAGMTRRIVLALIGALVLATVAIGYGAFAAARQPTPVAATGALSLTGPRIMFRSTAPDSKGQVAFVAKDNPGGPRSVSALTCLRVYAAGGTGTCLRQDGALATFQIAILDKNLNVQKAIPLVGVPNRTRVSGDGRLVAWTVFVAGDSYNHGRFSTRAGLIDLKTEDMIDSLEFLSVTLDGHPYTAPDLNFWGITFAADDNTFYATMSTAGQRYLAQGDIATKSVHTIARNVECPSLSPTANASPSNPRSTTTPRTAGA